MKKIAVAVISLSLMLLLVAGAFAVDADEATTAPSDDSTTTPIRSIVDIEIFPEKQKADENGKAVYKVLVSDLRDDKSLREHKYELEFSSPTAEGKLETNTLLLKSGESRLVELSVLGEKAGTHFFTVAVAGTDGKDTARGILLITTPIENAVSIKIFPEKQQADKNGKAVYKVTVSDLHNDKSLREHKYELEFSSPTAEGKLETNTLLLKSGESRLVELSVLGEKAGTHFFTVAVAGTDGKDTARGILLVGGDDGTIPKPTEPYFHGEGFITNRDSSEGHLISLNILKDGDQLKGRMKMDKQNLEVRGTASNNGKVQFTLHPPQIKNRVGSFEGSIKKFDEFLLLEGELITWQLDVAKVWDLTAFSKHKSIFIDVIGEDKALESVETELENVIAVEGTEETAVYVTPKKYTKKIFGIKNPWIGEKVLEFEVTKPSGEKVTETVRAFEKKQISEKYQIEVKNSLEDADEDSEIEIAVTPIES